MEYQNRLNAILSKPGNKSCADCNGRNPRWASISLGVFVCIRCCGLHRSLGTHISKMKSTTLDKWTPQMFEIFEGLDNLTANAYWESNLPSNYSKPVESTSAYNVEMFLRDKYERKLWIASGPDPVVSALSPKEKVPAKVEKRPEPRQNVSADLLNDTPVIPHKPSLAKTHSGGFESTPFNAFPNFPQHNVPNVVPQFVPSVVQNNPPPQFVQAPIYHQSNVVQYHPSPLQGGSQQAFNPHQGPPNPHHPSQHFVQQGYVDAEKNMKINQVLSMYGPQQPQPVPQANPGFKPLGAIAAQNFFNQNNRPQYPTF